MSNDLEIQTTEQQFTQLVRDVQIVNGRIDDDITHEVGLKAILEAKRLQTTWVTLFEPIREAQRKALDVTFAQINKLKVPLEGLIRELGQKCGDYELRRREAARLEEMKRQAEAKKAAEDVVLEQAVELHQDGLVEVAEALLSTPVPTAPVFATSVPAVKVKGLSSKTTWKAHVTDLAAFRAAYKAGKLPANVMMPDQDILDDLAAALQTEFQIPGVQAKEEVSYGKSGGRRK